MKTTQLKQPTGTWEEDIIKATKNKTLYLIFKQIFKENCELQAENEQLKKEIEFLRSVQDKKDKPVPMVIHFYKNAKFGNGGKK